MTVSDNTIQADVLGDFFKNLCKKEFFALEKMTSMDLLKHPGKVLEDGANLDSFNI